VLGVIDGILKVEKLGRRVEFHHRGTKVESTTFFVLLVYPPHVANLDAPSFRIAF
jgi:hypothetical protein